ncbi:DUF4065 domain-containing protein [Comamonadaceae bacterium OH2545_COT-014]|nr:DUF4065 domain-containing protein [Comamonadaceae bacterium OH2545_COT-014]
MSKITDVVKYICKNYPHSHELSKARLTKMIYLVDWESAKRHGQQITEIKWYFNNYGPYVDAVFDEAILDPEIDVIQTTTIYGTPKIQIKYSGDAGEVNINYNEKEIIDHIISQTKTMYWNSFIRHVYDTYPVRKNPQYSYLDLAGLAKQENSILKRDVG